MVSMTRSMRSVPGDPGRSKLKSLPEDPLWPQPTRSLAEPLEPRVFLSNTRFAVIGDFSAGQPEQDVSNLVKSWNPSFVVTVGDNNYPSGDASTIDANVGQYYHQYISPYKGTY